MNHNNKQSFFNAAVQAGRAKEWALMKANRHFKKEKPALKREAYKPGTLGLSAVSEAIKKDYSIIESRRDRKLIAKAVAKVTTLKRYYNGEAPVRVPHVVNPHRLSVRWR